MAAPRVHSATVCPGAGDGVCATLGDTRPLLGGGLCSSASVGLGHSSQADMLCLRYTFGNSGAEKSPGSPHWRA